MNTRAAVNDMTRRFDRSSLADWMRHHAAMLAVGGLAALKLVVHIASTGWHGYGFFVDELYFLACAEHLDWGYVDMPAVLPVVTAAVRAVFGDSLFAIRIVPTLAGAGLVVATAAIARAMGGGWKAQGLAGIAVVCAPLWLVLHSFHSMNPIDTLLWPACALIIVRLADGADPRLWLLLGVLGGFAMNTKHTVALFAIGLAIGILSTALRSHLKTRWPWLGAAIAMLLFVPNLVWMVQHDFPHLEQLANIRAEGRNVGLSPLAFVAQQGLLIHPVAAPLWLAGLGWLLFGRSGRRYRALGIAFVVVIGLLIATDGRVYYPGPAYPMLLAAGGVVFERWATTAWRRRVLVGWAGLAAIGGALMAPMWVPILSPEVYQRYRDVVGFDQVRIENHRLGPLPQLFADRFGWPEMARVVADAYHALPPQDRARCGIFGQNYGQAGAIDLFGPELGLPKAVSGHLTYWMWGPRGHTGEVMLVMGDRRERLEELFETVEPVGRIEHRYSMPYEHFDVFLCRGLQVPLDELWPRLKSYG